MEALVTGVITTYKRPPEIVSRAAKSILNQTYKNIELIIVDDSPSDYEFRNAVKKMVENLSGSVRYIQHETNMGACVARNTGIAEAEGEFIAFLDDDDEWLPDKIEKQIKCFSDSETALVYCGSYIVDEIADKCVIRKQTFKRGNVYKWLILQNFIGSTSFPLIRKTVLETAGGFNPEMKAAQDIELWLRIARDYKIDYVMEPLVNYYIHQGEQITKNYRVKLDALERLYELNMHYLGFHKKAHAIRILRMIPICIKVDKGRARKLFFKSLKLYPFYSKDLLRAVKILWLKRK